MRLTLARTSDAATIARMSRALVERGLAWRWRLRRVLRNILDDDVLAVVARAADGRILGFAFMHYGSSHAHLLLLAVSPRARRSGLGRRLVEWQLVCCRNCGIERVDLEVRATNPGARAFYEALGFQQRERVRRYYDGREDALRMTLDL